MKKQSKSDKAFIAKLKTLHIGGSSVKTGAELSQWAKANGVPEKIECDDCGGSASLVAVADVKIEVRRKHDDRGEVEVVE